MFLRLCIITYVFFTFKGERHRGKVDSSVMQSCSAFSNTTVFQIISHLTSLYTGAVNRNTSEKKMKLDTQKYRPIWQEV